MAPCEHRWSAHHRNEVPVGIGSSGQSKVGEKVAGERPATRERVDKDARALEVSGLVEKHSCANPRAGSGDFGGEDHSINWDWKDFSRWTVWS